MTYLLSAFSFSHLLRFFDDHAGGITAVFTVFLALSTTLLWVATKGLREDTQLSIKAAQDSARAATMANTINAENFATASRSWIAVEPSLRSDLTYDDFNKGAWLTVRFTLVNFGKSPATSVWVNASLRRDFKDAYGEHERLRADVSHHSVGHMLFPGETRVLDQHFSLSWSEMQKSMGYHQHHKWFSPVLVGCAVYKFVDDDTLHRTGFMASLHRISPTGSGVGVAFDVSEGSVAQSNILMEVLFVSYAT